MRPPKLRQLFDLQHPDSQQAAWVQSDSIQPAANLLFAETNIPVVVTNAYEWVLFASSMTRHDRNETPPLPHWRFVTTVKGPADLTNMPNHIRDLKTRPAPQQDGQIRLGKPYPRATPLGIQSVPSYNVTRATVSHNRGNSTPRELKALFITRHEENAGTIRVGDMARLDVQIDRDELPARGDIVQVVLLTGEGKRVVTGAVSDIVVVVNVLSIDAS